MNLKKKYFFDIFLIFLIFVFDRISKIYVIYISEKSFNPEIFSSKFLNIHLIWNEGIAFGLFSFQKENFYNILTIIIVSVIIVLMIMLIKSKGLRKYSFLMIFAGALGNVYDRISSKAVPDFIDLHVGDFHWFIFNVADIFITIGVIFLIMLELIGRNTHKQI